MRSLRDGVRAPPVKEDPVQRSVMTGGWLNLRGEETGITTQEIITPGIRNEGKHSNPCSVKRKTNGKKKPENLYVKKICSVYVCEKT